MRWFIVLLLLTITSVQAAEEPKAAPDKGPKIAPQAQPVYDWLKTVKAGDQEQLKTVFSAQMRKDFEKTDWAKLLKVYQDVFKQQFGDYRLEDFTFEYAGGEDKGAVVITHKDTKTPGVRVVKQDGAWKIDER